MRGAGLRRTGCCELAALGLALMACSRSDLIGLGDGGPDAGRHPMDAGPDAGPDAGDDAGPDAGVDAGPDAGSDSGCVPGDTGGQPVQLASWNGLSLGGLLVSGGVAYYSLTGFDLDQIGIAAVSVCGGTPSIVGRIDAGGGESYYLAGNDIAADANHVYWTTGHINYSTGEVLRVDLNGLGQVPLATGQPGPAAVAVDSSNVYWLNAGVVFLPDAGTSAVMRVPIDGGTPLLLATTSGPTSLAVAGGTVYWASGADGVFSVSTDGGPVSTLVTTLDANVLAVGPSAIYFCDFTSVYAVGLDGGTVTTLATGQLTPLALVLDGSTLYWVNQAPGTMSGGTVMKLPLGASSPTVLAANQSNPFGLAVDATSVYWINEVDGSPNAVMRLAPK